jgi:hypothetical protein
MSLGGGVVMSATKAASGAAATTQARGAGQA